MIDKELAHIDLFSGIGGFTLAASWVGFRTIVFCEKEKFCQKILKKRFGGIIVDPLGNQYRREKSGSLEEKKDIQGINRAKNSSPGKLGRTNQIWKSNNRYVPIIPEIRDFDGTKYRGATLLTGGFPCQPFSVAGQQRGKEDNRYLWPEMLRIISEAKPHWILAENVPGIFHMALDTVLADLEGEGYTTGTFIIPACGLNAPHRRNRVWIVAYNKNVGLQGMWSEREQKSDTHGKKGVSLRQNSHVADSKGRVIRGIRNKGKKKGPQDSNELFGDSNRLSWQENWYEVAAQFCRVDDGVSDRIHRLKALGNAIVPQIAHEILKNIAWIENEN